MSKKRMMSKQQRLYYEYSRKERIREELIEYTKQIMQLEQLKIHRGYGGKEY
jgi:hypothetical protein